MTSKSILSAVSEGSILARNISFLSASRRAAPMKVDRSLEEDVRREILRGVRLNLVLRGFGMHWSSSKGSSCATPAEEYALSELVDRLDDFLTHDWFTGRWPKFCALCVVYNSQAAILASLAMACLVSVLALDSVAVLPKPGVVFLRVPVHKAGRSFEAEQGFWGLILCPVTFYVVLFFNQRLRTLFRRPQRWVFVDKLCINQTQEDLKLEGILGLAGFLKHTSRLVMLWSPRYFTRLWCVYEVASWVHLGRDLRQSLHFLPVSLAVGLLAAQMGTFSFYLLLRFSWAVSSDLYVQCGLNIILIFVALAVPLHAVRRLCLDLMVLRDQVGAFSVRDAECFCCTHNHVHPVTGDQLPCDRKLVYETLSMWFSKSPQAVAGQAATEEVLEAFDELVRTKLKAVVGESTMNVRLLFQHCLISTAPVMWYSCDVFCGFGSYRPNEALREVAMWMCIFLFVLPCGMRLAIELIVVISRMLGRVRCLVLDVLVTIVVALVALFMFVSLWAPLAVFADWAPWGPQAAYSLGLVALTAWLFIGRPRCCRPWGRAAAATAAVAKGSAVGDAKDSDVTDGAQRSI